MTEDELILTHLLQCSRSELLLHQPRLTDQQRENFNSYRARRLAGEPLQYILGCCDFMGLELKVDPRVLIPRPETEVLVDEAIKRLKAKGAVMILDLGTGSGNIAIALAKFLPDALVTSVDNSPAALELAKENAIKQGVEARIEFIRGSMDLPFTDQMHGVPKCFHEADWFHLVISNPPYIPLKQMAQLPKDVQQEPRSALYGGLDGLDFYRNIIKYTPPLLRKGGYLMMEFGDGQGTAIKELIEEQKAFSKVEILPDLAGRDRMICAQKP